MLKGRGLNVQFFYKKNWIHDNFSNDIYILKIVFWRMGDKK